MLRYCADIVVILGCGYIGMVLASGMDARIRQLESLERMMMQLAFNIGFLALPLPEAMRRTTETQQGAIRRVLTHVTELMERFPDITMNDAWEEAIRVCKNSLCLEREELTALNEFARHIGQGDSKAELDNIRLTSAKLKLSIEQAREKQKKDGKLCRGFGFLTGIMIVLVLA